MHNSEYLDKSRQLMKFYFDEMFSEKLPELKRRLAAAYPMQDPEYLFSQLEVVMDKVKDSMAEKVHHTCLLMIDFAVAGRIPELKDFEIRFIDLLERTLLKGVSLQKLAEQALAALIESLPSKNSRPHTSS